MDCLPISWGCRRAVIPLRVSECKPGDFHGMPMLRLEMKAYVSAPGSQRKSVGDTEAWIAKGRGNHGSRQTGRNDDEEGTKPGVRRAEGRDDSRNGMKKEEFKVTRDDFSQFPLDACLWFIEVVLGFVLARQRLPYYGGVGKGTSCQPVSLGRYRHCFPSSLEEGFECQVKDWNLKGGSSRMYRLPYNAKKRGGWRPCR